MRLPSSRAGRIRLAAAATAVVLGLVLLANAGRALIVRRDVGPPDVIVMLASHENERLPAAAALARQYPDSRVLLTMPRTVTQFNCYRCMERPEWFVEEGVERHRVAILPWQVGNTHDEAAAFRKYVDVYHPARVVVVTSPYHTRRALATFRQALKGTSTQVGTEPATATSPARPGRWWWYHYDRGYVAYEWAAILYYFVRFGVPLMGT